METEQERNRSHVRNLPRLWKDMAKDAETYRDEQARTEEATIRADEQARTLDIAAKMLDNALALDDQDKS